MRRFFYDFILHFQACIFVFIEFYAGEGVGMEIALPFEFWSKRIDGMSDRELGGYLKTLSGKIDMAKFAKSRRGPKKKVTKIYVPKVNHVSTFKITPRT